MKNDLKRLITITKLKKLIELKKEIREIKQFSKYCKEDKNGY